MIAFILVSLQTAEENMPRRREFVDNVKAWELTYPDRELTMDSRTNGELQFKN
jgi:hypothetical protein